jgi:hypothetical protein
VKHLRHPAVQDMSNGDDDNDYGGDEDKNKNTKMNTWVIS